MADNRANKDGKVLMFYKDINAKTLKEVRSFGSYLSSMGDAIARHPLVILSIALGGAVAFFSGILIALITRSFSTNLTNAKVGVFALCAASLTAMIVLIGSEYATAILVATFLGGVFGFVSELYYQRTMLARYGLSKIGTINPKKANATS
jgi:hypothetical protein